MSRSDLLDNAGKISHEKAKIEAGLEYKKHKEQLTKIEKYFIEHVKNTQNKLEKGRG